MNKNITGNILSVCTALNKHQVQYLIVGGTAVAMYGYFRWSHNEIGSQTEKYDLDIWYNPTYDNYFKLLNALEELGQDVLEFREEQSPNPKNSFFRYDMEDFTLDFLTELKGLSKFRLSFNKKEVINFNGIDILVINIDDLIKDKETDSRPKDLIDIKHLKAKRNYK